MSIGIIPPHVNHSQSFSPGPLHPPRNHYTQKLDMPEIEFHLLAEAEGLRRPACTVAEKNSVFFLCSGLCMPSQSEPHVMHSPIRRRKKRDTHDT